MLLAHLWPFLPSWAHFVDSNRSNNIQSIMSKNKVDWTPGKIISECFCLDMNGLNGFRFCVIILLCSNTNVVRNHTKRYRNCIFLEMNRMLNGFQFSVVILLCPYTNVFWNYSTWCPINLVFGDTNVLNKLYGMDGLDSQSRTHKKAHKWANWMV